MDKLLQLDENYYQICTDPEKRQNATIDELLQLSNWLSHSDENQNVLSEINTVLISKIEKLDDPSKIINFLFSQLVEDKYFQPAIFKSFKNLIDENLINLMDYYLPTKWDAIKYKERLVKDTIISSLSKIDNLNFQIELYSKWNNLDCQSNILLRIEESLDQIDNTSILGLTKLLSKLENGNLPIYQALVTKIKDIKDLSLLLHLYISAQKSIRLVLTQTIETQLNNKIIDSLPIEDLQLVSLNAIQDNNTSLLSTIDSVLFPKIEKLTNPRELQNIFFFNDRNIPLKVVILETLERLVVTKENYSDWNHQRRNHKINAILDRKTQQYIDCLSLDTDVNWKDLYDQSNKKNQTYIRDLLKKRDMTNAEKKLFFKNNNNHSKGVIFDIASKNHPTSLFNNDLIKAYKQALLTNNINDQEILESIIIDRMTK